MDELQKLDLKIRIASHFRRLKVSREDLEKHYPHKAELIKNLKEAENEMLFIEMSVREALDELHLANRRNYDLELINLKLQSKVNELELLNKSLIKRVEL